MSAKAKETEILADYQVLDARLVAVAKSVKILSELSWPAQTAEAFLQQWRKGKAKLPTPPAMPEKPQVAIGELKDIEKKCSQDHPIGAFIRRTAQSYITTCEMLGEVGKPRFTELSIQLYGKPTDRIGSNHVTHLDAARHFIETTKEFIEAFRVPEDAYCVRAETIAEELRNKLKEVFKKHPVEIVIDPTLVSKAAASSRRIRLRGGTCYSSMDLAQLYHHEAMTHSLTQLNGQEQPNLKCLGLSSPRTTRTQEGLATFSELVTGAMDLNRLQRIAIRIAAVQKALEGADFIEVFKYFLEAGQAEDESVHSTIRIFRGGDLKGRVVFTKDVVYLQGLILVHTFLRKTIQANRPEFPHYLCAGRLTLGDIVALEPYFQSGYIAKPIYEPKWIQNRQALAAYLCYAVFANRISLGDFEMSDFIKRDL